MPNDPESLGTGIGPLLADLIPLMPSGARRAGAARVMAARVGRDPSVLIDQPRITQLLALGLGAVGGAYTQGQSTPVRLAAIAGPLTLVQLLRRMELGSIQKSYDTDKRKRLRELDEKALLDSPGWFGTNGSTRLGAVSAYETMRDRKYKGYSSLAEAGDALHLAAGGLHPGFALPMSTLVSILDNKEAQGMRDLSKQAEFTDQRNMPAIPLYLAAALAGSAGLVGARHVAINEGRNTAPLGTENWAGMIGRVSGTEPMMLATQGNDNAFFYKPRTQREALSFLNNYATGLQDVTSYAGGPRRGDYGQRMDQVNRLMRAGVIVADDTAGAPTIAHEAGHAKIEETPGILRALQRHVYPHQSWIAPLAGAGSMAAGLASGSALKGGLLGTGIGALAGLGHLGPEAGASYHAMRGLGGGTLTTEGKKDLLAALSTYLAFNVLPSTLSGVAGGWISGRRKKKREAEEEGVEKAAGGAWRKLLNIGKVFKAQGGNLEHLGSGQNLAALKQTMGQTMRAPATDKIGQRVMQQERNAMNAARAPYRGDDDAMKAFVDSTRQRSSHERLFDRFGQDMPSFNEGSRVFRGTVGGNPWGGGAYNGAFQYAAPTPAGAAFYGRQPASFLAPEARGILSSRSHLETIHHYGAGPNQKMWQPWGPEDAITSSAKNRARILRDGPGTFGGNAETAVMQQHNPYLGTALRATSRDGAYGAAKFFPAGRPGQAAQNYVGQISQGVKMAPDGTLQTAQQQVSGLNTTPWQASVDASPSLSRLQSRNPVAFQGVMNRRADRMLGPSGFEKASAWDPRKMWEVLSRIQSHNMSGNLADEYVKGIFGVHYKPLKRGFSKLPLDVQQAAKLPLPPAPVPMLPPAAPAQGLLDLFKQGAHPALPMLLEAKRHSDAKRYDIKNRYIRQNMRRDPDSWIVDSDDGKGIVGVTHTPTGFRLHMLKSVVDPDVLKYHNAVAP